MAESNIPITVSGIDVVIKVLKKFDDNFEFEDDVSEEFKDGFNLCKDAMIMSLEKLENGGDE